MSKPSDDVTDGGRAKKQPIQASSKAASLHHTTPGREEPHNPFLLHPALKRMGHGRALISAPSAPSPPHPHGLLDGLCQELKLAEVTEKPVCPLILWTCRFISVELNSTIACRLGTSHPTEQLWVCSFSGSTHFPGWGKRVGPEGNCFPSLYLKLEVRTLGGRKSQI